MSAAILSIGTELTRGELTNTNASWLAESLTAIGLEVTAIETIDDERERIQRVLARMASEHDFIVCTGGLGPTTDDLTTECVARLLGVPLERDAASLDAIRARMERFGRTMAASNAKQADFPAGARILPNRHGTAPGFGVNIGKARAFFLPGVPREMKGLFEEYVESAARELVTTRVHQILFRTFGMTESAVNDRLSGIEEEYGVTIGYRAHFPEIEVKVLARAETLEAAEAGAEAAAAAVRARLGDDVIYGTGTSRLPQVVGQLLTGLKVTLGVAESCTGGLVSTLLTDEGGSSSFFEGGAVTYSNSLKERLLGVPDAVLAAHGAVSREVARSMAEGALRALRVPVSLALTGIAGPGGGTADKPVGLVHIAVATNEGTTDSQINFPGTREQVRKLAAYAGLSLVRRVLLFGHGKA